MARKKKDDYTGKQYRGGRVAGRKNLQKVGDKLVNQHGVQFTAAEKKQLEQLVNTANRKRKRMLEQEGALPRMLGGRDMGDTIGETVGRMGKESDFILSKKTKSLNRFNSRLEYEKYIANLKNVNQRDYVERRVELYKKNHIEALKNVFGADSKDIVEALENMDTKEYMKRVQSDELLEINYTYSPHARKAKLDRLRNALLGDDSDASNGRRLRNNNRRKGR